MVDPFRVRRRMLAGGALGALCIGLVSTAAAQQAPASEQEPVAEEAIIVTGSRIARPDYSAPNPVVSIDAAAIQQSGTTNLTNFLTETPALAGSFNSNDGAGDNAGIGYIGLNLLDLRNLGTDRTLVLVDARRHVSAVPGSAAVDVNTIPMDLIDRVEVLTGGASAIYGADGVSGVVNFVTKRNFEGLSARAQAGVSQYGDGASQLFSITAGKNFLDDRANIAASFEYGHEDRLTVEQRRNLSGTRALFFRRNPADPNDSPNLPDEVPLADTRFNDTSRGGGVDIDFDGLPEFVGDGSVFDRGRFIRPFYQQGGSGTLTSDYTGDLLPKLDRYVGNLLFNYKVSDSVNFFAQGKYARSKSFSVDQPTFDYTIYMFEENPYIPANIRSAIIPGIGAELADELGVAPFSDGVAIGRDNFDFGLRGEENDRETIRTVVGFDGDIAGKANFELSYVFGQSKFKSKQIGNRWNDRFLAAVDVVADPVTGAPTCRVNTPLGLRDNPTYDFFGGYAFPSQLSFTPGPNSGCKPLNLFGEGAPSQEALDWIMTTSIDRSTIRQHVVTGVVDGTLGEGFKLWGGEIGYAVGAEYRKESSSSNPSAETRSGLTFGNVQSPVKGDFDVKEVFAEIRVPVIEGRPFADTLEFTGAIRLSDYSTVGSTTTWQVGGVWSPIRDISFRGTYAEAVRAPNIGELFDPGGQDYRRINDPCDVDYVDNGTSFRQANCAALLTSLGANPATFVDPNSSTIDGITGGNEDLGEETAKTITAGVVLRPRFVPGLTFAVDYYDIKLTNAISYVSAQQLADLCVDMQSLDNPFCGAITRQQGGTGAGRITFFRRQPENVAEYATRGVDFNLNYRLTPAADIGTFNFRLVGNYLDKLTFIGTPGAPVISNRGYATEEAPKWQLNFDATWAKGPLTFNYGVNYFSETRRHTLETLAANPDIVEERYRNVKAKFQHDAQLAFEVDEQFTLYGGVNNITNQKPDVGLTFYPISAVGRFFYIGARASFGAF